MIQTSRELFDMSLVKKRQQQMLQSGNTKSQQAITKVTAAVSDSASADRPAVMADFDLYKIAIDADLAQLKKLSDVADKAEYKAKAIADNDYMDYLSRYKNSGANHPNSVVTWLVIWLVDLGRWHTALEYLPMLIEQEQRLPTAFKTENWQTFFIDQLYDEGAKQLAKGRDAIEQSQVMQLFGHMTAHFEQQEWVVNEVVGGKLFAMAAKLEQASFNFGNAYNLCVKATALNDKAGVKKLAKELAKVIGKATDI